MERIIKFSGISQVNGEWVYGHLFPGSLFNDPDYLADYWIATGFENQCYPVKELTISQFTGQYDINGKEIYEGDIRQDKKVVVFNRGAFCLYNEEKEIELLNFDSSSYCSDSWIVESDDYFKIIGNIYDNPELIK